MSQEDLQRKYIELKILEQQTSQIQQQLILLDNQLSIMEKTRESIEDLKSAKPGSNIFIPVGQGVFAKGKLEDASHLLVGVGNNVVVSKTAEESKIIVEKQINELNSVIKHLEEQLQQFTMHARIIEEEIQQLSSKNK